MIEINNLSKDKLVEAINNKIFSTVAKKVLSGENRKTETISLAFVDEPEMQALNKEFRSKDSPTDVLSFEMNDFLLNNKGKKLLGEIVICPKVVQKNAAEDQVAFESEMLKVFVHGVLHLCGYDHERSEAEVIKMEELQKKYLSGIKK